MSDRREEILNSEHQKLIDDRGFPRDGGEIIFVHRPAAISAMDEYMKTCCLELLEYMAKNDVKCTWYNHDVFGRKYVFKYKGVDLTKEQLFENFL